MCAFDGLRRDREVAASAKHDRRVAEREEEADAERPLALLQQLPGRVVDRRDVVRVEGVAQAEGVREHAEAGERRIRARVPDEQAPAERRGAGRRRRRSRRGGSHSARLSVRVQRRMVYLTFGRARAVMATPATRMTSGAERPGGRGSRRPSKRRRAANARFASTATSPTPVIESASPSAERDDQDEPESDPVERDRREQHDERRRAREQPAGDADRKQAPQAASGSCSWSWWWW